MSAGFLPYARPVIDEDDINAVVGVLRSGWLTTGPEVEAFERELAAATGARYAVVCANGTAALHLTCLAMGIGFGDRVIVPSVTFLATANAPTLCGAEIIFADIDPQTGRMTAQTLEDAFRRAGPGVRAVFNVHLAGPCEDVAALAQIADRHGAELIEDACHALGTRYATGTDQEGRIGDARHARAVCFSFHAVKTIAMGEGGAITTNDECLARAMRNLRNHGMTRDAAEFTQSDEGFSANGAVNPWYYEMSAPGFNYRATDIQCALGRSQLVKLERFTARRAELKSAYDDALKSAKLPIEPPVSREDCAPAWHLYPVGVDFEAAGVDRAELMSRLSERGVGAQVHYLPVHRQPFYRARNRDLTLPGADGYYAKTLSLPLFPAMSREDVTLVVEALGETLSRKPKAPVRKLAATKPTIMTQRGPEVVIRADASASLGGGHVMRMLTLARALTRRGADCRFAVNEEALRAAPALETSPFDVATLKDSENAQEFRSVIGDSTDIVIFDHYALGAAYEGALRGSARALVVIDDLADRAHEVDLIIDSTPGRAPSAYKELAPSARVLAGPAYALLRPEFSLRREEALARRSREGAARRVFVSLGLTDVNAVTAQIAAALEQRDFELSFDVVTPARAPSRPVIEELCARDERFRIIEADDDLADLMARADLAVGAGGQTALERACLGLPSVLVILADNQRAIARALAEGGACRTATLEDQAEGVATAVAMLARDAGARRTMSQRAAAVVDGMGADRCADEIMSLVSSKEKAA